MMRELRASSRNGHYPVLVAPALLDRLASLLAPFAANGSLVVVTDTRVWSLYGEQFRKACRPLTVKPVCLEPGEGRKSWAGAAWLLDELVRAGVRRDSTIVAFGGGVVGDLTGFVASLLHRGCAYIQIPTTLLAQLDSSIGGKTAINTNHGKNQAGTFHFPETVLIDPLLLRSLPDRQLRSGYAEALKIALIEDEVFFEWLEENGERCLVRDSDALGDAVTAAIRGKLGLVAGDELDRGGRRRLLNFGHTFAHAIEVQSRHEVLHGEAVAVGMALAFELSEELGYCSASDRERVRRHLGMVELPATLGAAGIAGRDLCPHFAADKKAEGEALRFIMTRGIGAAFVDSELTVERVAQFLGGR